MPKKIYAVTNVKVGSGPGQFVAAGEEIDANVPGFDKKALLELHSQGAIEVRVVEEETIVEVDTEPETTAVTETPVEETSNSETGANEQ